MLNRHIFPNLVFLCALAVPPLIKGNPVPQNLGNGLNKIVENQLLQQGVISVPAPNQLSATKSVSRKQAKSVTQTSAAYVNSYKATVAKEAGTYIDRAIMQIGTSKYLVDIMPDGHVPIDTLQPALQARFPALDVKHLDKKYAGHGVIEAYISVTDAPAIATFNGVRSVVLQLRPIHSVGLTTSQGINQHRVNRINQLYNASSVANYDGTGISIGVMSDSFNSQPSEEGGFTTAQADVGSGDLPGGTGVATGGANLNPNAQPVVVLEDYNPTPGATNEGRGMCQIVADMAPMARIGFATADTGEVGFANNIRALGGLPGFTYPDATQQGFKGDVVCDDVSYLDEPMFQDGIVAQGVIDVVNAGVSYCSSAANNWGTDGYDSDFRLVPNGTGLTAAANSALTGTNIDLTGVDPSLYAGGFHNFNPNPGQQDIAQQFNADSDPQAAVLQWNDPYDTSTPTLGPIIYGPVNADSEPTSADPSYTINFTAGQEYVITEHATPATPADNYDAIVEVKDPAGNTIVLQDTGVDETVILFAPTTGTYTIIFHAFATASPVGGPAIPTRGPFQFQINTANGVPRITQDFNLLFFDGTTGAFIEAVASNNIANNRPYEVWVPDLSSHKDANGQVQLVISRANVTAPPNAANHFKYVFFGNGATGIGPAEYNNYLTPVTFGHSTAAGANGVAAYPMFRPNLPEDFTSPGPATIYFDTNNNRLATPQVRLKPDIAAADGANNTFFPLGPVQDVPWDIDAQYANFYGTSAASPHSAAIAGLIIQAHGGTGSISPQNVKTLMQLTAFPHDLDPYSSTGTASAHGGIVTVNIVSDNDSNTGTGSNDSNAWSVTYNGPGYVKQLVLNPNNLPAEGGNPTGGNYTGGAAPGTATEYSDFLNVANYNFTPGMVFNSNQYVNGTRSDVTGAATFSNQASSPPGLNAFNRTVTLALPANGLVTGKAYRFNIGRAQEKDANTPVGLSEEVGLYGQSAQNSADILGSGVLIPEYADNPQVLQGLVFSGIVTDGGVDYPFTGRITNKVGHGYSPLDGYGFVNAQAATTGVVPAPGVVSRKIHGAAGTFDIPLPFNGPAGIECRLPGANNSYQLVFTFDRPVANAGTVAIQGSGSVTPPAGDQANPAIADSNPNQILVNLQGVTNQQHLVVTLNNVRDSSGTIMPQVTARMDVLIGDVTASGRTDAGDQTVARNNSVSIPTQATFRADVNCSGRIDSGDQTLIRNASVTALP
jgi:Subtilase family